MCMCGRFAQFHSRDEFIAALHPGSRYRCSIMIMISFTWLGVCASMVARPGKTSPHQRPRRNRCEQPDVCSALETGTMRFQLYDSSGFRIFHVGRNQPPQNP